MIVVDWLKYQKIIDIIVTIHGKPIIASFWNIIKRFDNF